MQRAEYLYISEPAATVVAAIIGAIATFIGTWLGFVLPERKKRSAFVADFLQTIAESVTQMIAMFEKREIPHQAGHELASNITFFEEATNRKFLSKMALETLDKLKVLSQDAVVVDVVLYKGENSSSARSG